MWWTSSMNVTTRVLLSPSSITGWRKRPLVWKPIDGRNTRGQAISLPGQHVFIGRYVIVGVSFCVYKNIMVGLSPFNNNHQNSMFVSSINALLLVQFINIIHLRIDIRETLGANIWKVFSFDIFKMIEHDQKKIRLRR